MTRKRLKKQDATPEPTGGLYFDKPNNVETTSSGCPLLDCVLGGGWAMGRVSNVVGDKSTGKTQLAIEGLANFHNAHPDGLMAYNDAEAAFDKPYASVLGLPVDEVDFGDRAAFNTVQDFFTNVEAFLKRLKKRQHGFFVVDSLDALMDASELDSAFGDTGYGTAKAKHMSELFRRLIRILEEKNCHLMIISQVRDVINAMFGRKSARTGGRALDFYASQILYLVGMQKIKKTIGGVMRPVGVHITAKCDKNKVGMPYRECSFPIMFAYGIDDVTAGVEWLIEVKRTDALATDWDKADAHAFLNGLHKLTPEEFKQERENVANAVRKVWREIEVDFAPKRSKY